MAGRAALLDSGRRGQPLPRLWPQGAEEREEPRPEARGVPEAVVRGLLDRPVLRALRRAVSVRAAEVVPAGFVPQAARGQREPPV